MLGIRALYTENALYASSTGTLAEGAYQVAAFLQGYLNAGYETVAFDSRKLRVEGDMAYNFGHWQWTHAVGSAIEPQRVGLGLKASEGLVPEHVQARVSVLVAAASGA